MKRTHVEITAQPGEGAQEAWRALGRLAERVGPAWVLRPGSTGPTVFSLRIDGDLRLRPPRRGPTDPRHRRTTSGRDDPAVRNTFRSTSR